MRVLTQSEVNEVSGAVNWGEVAAGAALVALAVAVVATDGLAAIPIGIIAGAGTVGEVGTAAVAVGTAGFGGYVMGRGMLL